jgi:uncharacterized protein YdaU (DUF1376 family)
MSERPFMQLYVSDYLGDTRHLSCEQHGAYMLLLMTMWNAGGKLPDDDTKLARIVCLSVKKWRSIREDVLSFFEVSGGVLSHNRMTKELLKSESKSQSRASAGAKGGAAKALKDKGQHVANATRLPQHLPDTRNHIAATQQRAPDLIDLLTKAAGITGNITPGLAFPGEIIGLMHAGFDLDNDILPAIRARPNPRARTWAYFVPQIRDAVDRRNQAASTPAPTRREVDWEGRVQAFREDGTWAAGWGPKPGEAGCNAPSEIIGRAAA